MTYPELNTSITWPLALNKGETQREAPDMRRKQERRKYTQTLGLPWKVLLQQMRTHTADHQADALQIPVHHTGLHSPERGRSPTQTDLPAVQRKPRTLSGEGPRNLKPSLGD